MKLYFKVAGLQRTPLSVQNLTFGLSKKFKKKLSINATWLPIPTNNILVAKIWLKLSIKIYTILKDYSYTLFLL